MSGKGVNSITKESLAVIVDSVNSVAHGTVTLIIQDSRLLQIERNDKIRLDNKTPVKRAALTAPQIERLRIKILSDLKDLEFGQIILTLKGGALVQIERTEKQRYSGLEGIYGDGI